MPSIVEECDRHGRWIGGGSPTPGPRWREPDIEETRAVARSTGSESFRLDADGRVGRNPTAEAALENSDVTGGRKGESGPPRGTVWWKS